MKTVVTKASTLASAAALFFAIAAAGTAQAADAVSPAMMAPPPAFDPSAGSLPSSVGANAGRDKNLAPLEDKVSDSVKNVVKQFGSTDNVNLEDLNTARQAIAKLEVLIDIEKRLAELEKIRSEHGGAKSLAAAIPATALAPPPMFSAQSFPKASMSGNGEGGDALPPPVRHVEEVSRVTGVNGHYTANIQGKTVYVGDKLSDGSTVTSITARDVELKKKDGTITRLKVKGVQEIYGHTL